MVVVETEDLVCYLKKERFHLLCKEGCPNYEKKWSCPPYAPAYEHFTNKYKYIQVVMLLTEMEHFDYIRQEYLKVKAANSVLKSRVDKALRRSMKEEEFYISTGSCRLCKPCKKKENQPCAHPDKRSFSFEALGIDVSEMTTELFQTELVWYKDKKAPKYTCVVAGLLTNEKRLQKKIVEKLMEMK